MFTFRVFSGNNCNWVKVGHKIEKYAGLDWECRLFAKGSTKQGVTTFILPIVPSGGVLEVSVTDGFISFSQGRVHTVGNPNVTIMLRDVAFHILADQEYKASNPDSICNMLHDAFDFHGHSLVELISNTTLETIPLDSSITEMTGRFHLGDNTVLDITIRVRDAFACFDAFGFRSSGAGDVYFNIIRRVG